jgi:hypothetical protein
MRHGEISKLALPTAGGADAGDGKGEIFCGDNGSFGTGLAGSLPPLAGLSFFFISYTYTNYT